MKYYIIAGEASGDLHASNLMKEIKKRDAAAVFRCWGGDKMKEQGGELVKHYKELAFMGFAEVISNLRTILRNIAFCKKDVLSYNPDVLILVDYPGFNLRIAKYAHKLGLKIFYYISPQVWAWKQSRVKLIKEVTDKLFVILPFEKEFYARFDCDVDFVGHPLLDAIENDPLPALKVIDNIDDDKPLVALLPGSRKQEVSRLLPVMSQVAIENPNYRYIVAGTSSVPKEVYAGCLNGTDVLIEYDNTYALLGAADAALVTSGTATLETALFGVPEVVCYKGSPISYMIAKQVIKTKYISLVNLIMDRKVVSELIQGECNAKNMGEELKKILNQDTQRSKMIEDFKELKEKLGGSGASANAAEGMLKALKE